MMTCSECGHEERSMKTTYRPDDGDEHALCERCYGEVAGEVLIVPGPAYCFGTCRECGGWFSVRDLSERTGGGRYSSPVGLCRGCSGEPA